MTAPSPLCPLRRVGQAGSSIIELMIAVVVALVLLAALAAMYGSSVKARNEIERTNRQIENGRYASQLLRDDVQLAGFYGELNMVDQTPELPRPGVLPNVCVTHLSANPGDGVVVADATFDGTLNGLDYLAVSMHLHVQGFDNVDPADATLPDCIAGLDLRPATDIIVVRRVLTCDAAAGCPFTANAPHLQASQCGQTGSPEISTTPFFLRAVADSAVNATFTLRDQNCINDGTYNANNTPVRRFITHIYFIANNNVAGDGIPTLKRLDLRADGWFTEALVEGIENMQLEYGVDGNDGNADGIANDRDADGTPDEPNDGEPDGVPDQYLSDPADATTIVLAASTCPNFAVCAWASVATVRLNLLSRSTEKRPGYQDENTYAMGNKTIDAKNLTSEERSYPRQVIQTVIQLRNPQGRRL